MKKDTSNRKDNGGSSPPPANVPPPSSANPAPGSSRRHSDLGGHSITPQGMRGLASPADGRAAPINSLGATPRGAPSAPLQVPSPMPLNTPENDDEFDAMLAREMQEMKWSSGEDANRRLSALRDQIRPAVARPAPQVGGATNPYERPTNPMGYPGPESPNQGAGSQPPTPARPLSRAPAASVCAYCGSANCTGSCPGAMQQSPIQALWGQPVRPTTNTPHSARSPLHTPSQARVISSPSAVYAKPSAVTDESVNNGSFRPNSAGDIEVYAATHAANNTPRNPAGRRGYHIDAGNHFVSSFRAPRAEPVVARAVPISSASRPMFSSSSSAQGVNVRVVHHPRPVSTASCSSGSSAVSSKTQPSRFAEDLQKWNERQRKSKKKLLRSESSAFSDAQRSAASVPSPIRPSRNNFTTSTTSGMVHSSTE